MKKKLFISFLIALVVTSVVFVVGCSVALPAFDPSKLDNLDHVTVIYDRNGNEVAKLKANNSTYVPLNKISKYVVEGVVATEDSRFYEHSGIDFRGILRAIYVDVIKGSKEQGASTITQQLARNVYLNQDKTFTRKIEEVFYAAQIERHFSKDEILEKYLNRAYFGAPNYSLGVEAAAETFFGKPASDLNLAEGALIAGLPQAPSLYNPLVNPQAAIQRRNIVLDNMVKSGYITQQQADEAKKVPYQKPAVQKDSENEIKYPYYLDYVVKEASDLYQIPEDQIIGGGLRIYTNLDPKIQSIMEEEFQKDSNFPANWGNSQAQGAMVVTDPKTGGILGMVGGRGEHQLGGGFNRAFQMRRSPGSSIKPLVVYGPAIDSGKYGPYSLLNDQAGTRFGDYQPKDWDGRGRGQVTMMEALRESWNIPAVSLLQEIGIDTGKQFAERAGIVFDDSDNNLAIALGGMKNGVSPLMMADAYDAFDNNGVRIPAYAIKKIETESGSVIAEANPQQIQVMKAETARTMTSLLQVVVNSGTGMNAQLTTGQPVAGKTGSTEYGAESNRDAWFVGYTPKYVGAVWMGFDDSSHGENVPEGSKIAAKFFSTVMSRVTKGEPMTYFESPPTQKTEPKKDENATQTLTLQAAYAGDAIKLSWNAVDGDVMYGVFRAENVDGKAVNGTLIGYTKDSTFIDTNVDPAKGYIYVVTAVDPNNQSHELARSAQVSVSPSTPAKDDQEKDKGKSKHQKRGDSGDTTGGNATGPGTSTEGNDTAGSGAANSGSSSAGNGQGNASGGSANGGSGIGSSGATSPGGNSGAGGAPQGSGNGGGPAGNNRN
jgi:penicillin-binding protein 2A